jgi:superfamily II DNA or RNA helicase/ribosomal protein L32
MNQITKSENNCMVLTVNTKVSTNNEQINLELRELFANNLSYKEKQQQKTQIKTLRDYQKKVVADVYHWYSQGKNSVLVYAPTGSGKTVMSAQIIADYISDGKKILFVLHRIPLVEQTIKTVENLLGYKLKLTIYQGENTVINPDAQIIIGMVQSLKEKKLPEHVDLVVFDEVHTTAYYKIVREIKHKYQPIPFQVKTKFLGLTATPWRTKSSENFCWLFDVLVRSPDINELIKLEYLTPPRMFGYNGLIDYTNADTNNGDFTPKFLNVVCNETLNTEIVDKYVEFANGKQALAFCAGVIQAENLLVQFRHNGIKADIWVGSTPDFQRKTIQKAFRNKEIQVIVSVSCLSEGFDEPSAEVALIGRPTKSQALFIQMIGRVLRISKEKTEALILDFCDNFDRIGTPLEHFKISLCPPILKNKAKLEVATKTCPDCGYESPISTRICPECGYEYKREKETKDFCGDNFGEILAKEQLERLKYLRSQIRNIFTKLDKYFLNESKKSTKLNPNRAKILFREKYGYFPPREWYEGAIFGGSKEQHHKNLYRTYLEWLFPAKMDFFYEDIMQHEFGKLPQKARKKDPKINAIPTAFNWHIVLGIAKNATKQEVKDRYKQLALQYHPDIMAHNLEATVIMQNINLAWDYAKSHFDKA